MRPELNRTAVTPSTTPKSLRAFPVQLNCGKLSIASKINVNATIGAIVPQTPDILSQLTFFEPIPMHTSRELF
jgi:hypothetical protein